MECFENEELATKVIPSISFTIVDKEKCVEFENASIFVRPSVHRLVRDQAFKALQLFIKKLEEYTATLVSFKSRSHCCFLNFFSARNCN